MSTQTSAASDTPPAITRASARRVSRTGSAAPYLRGKVTLLTALDELLGFFRLVGDTLGRAVILSCESEEHPLIIYEPSRREFQYHEAA